MSLERKRYVPFLERGGVVMSYPYDDNGSGYESDPYAKYREVDEKKSRRSGGKKKRVLSCIAFVLVGVLLGGAISVGLNLSEKIKPSQEANEAVVEESEPIEDIAPPTPKPEAPKTSEAKEQEENGSEENELFAGGDETIGSTRLSGDRSVAEIVENCMPSVVAITNKGVTEVRSMWGNFTQESESSGSGVIIGETDTELLILTNYHVVEDAQQLSVVFSWEEETAANAAETDITTAQLKDYDVARDFAVIVIPMSSLSNETKANISIASIGDSEELKLGQQVVAIGNALGYGQSVTTGIVSALNREIKAQSGNTELINRYIQTDAAINPGNSGGALFNLRGELIGINSAKISNSSVEGMGYAIPITDIIGDVENMMNEDTRLVVEESKRGFLGISVVNVTPEISASYGLPIGVYISSAFEGSGAEAAGLGEGDIVVAVNGKTVTDVTELRNYLSYYEVGETVTVTVQRQRDGGYKPEDVEVTLTPANEPESSEEEQVQEQQQRPQQGGGSQNGGTIFDLPYGLGGLFGY